MEDAPQEQQSPADHNRQIHDQVGARLDAKKGQPSLICPICAGKTWSWGFYVPLPIHTDATKMGFITPKIYPTVALICTTCGNTQLLNLRVLGFTEEEMAALKLQETWDPSEDA